MLTQNELILKEVFDSIPIEVICERLQYYLQNHQTIDIGTIDCKVAKSIDHNHE